MRIKKKLSKSTLSGSVFGALLLVSWQLLSAFIYPDLGQATSFDGAWRLVKTSDAQRTASEVVKIIADNTFTFADYDQKQKQFFGAGGGIFKQDKNTYTETFEYYTPDSGRVGTALTYKYALKGNTLQLVSTQKNRKIEETWERIDADTDAPLFGAWRIRERETQAGQMSVMQRGPRKTIKWLSGSRFQWAAINTQTKQFFGTGGGTYTLQNGKYTENIQFFSRDANRVCSQVTFDYEVKNSDWHHRGLSTAGNKIYEIWARGK